LSSKKHPLGEKRNHPGSKLRQGFWMIFRLGVNNWGIILFENLFKPRQLYLQPQSSALSNLRLAS
ncbi:hypothetical protein RLB20_00905, partial [Streptococcus pneumoniae]|nr:hypothetical protein [Streptococcus pneumoniae]MDS3404876.1 hypothetical protein [Streptococcus pneumoniae]MDS3447897.1 hypothetical protein [Streptococcus pneumoniae]MDS5162089.1 hypothetical protein [Streptococcus pneumoniae]MDS5602327.1 hypothetical protein [Streptococcus pneumoniae]